MGTNHPINHHHADAGQVAAPDAVQNGFAGGVLGLVKEDEGGGATHINQATVEIANLRRVSRGETDGGLRRYVSQGGEHGNKAQDTKRLHARTSGRVGAQNHAVKLLELAGGEQSQQSGLFIAIVNNFQSAS